MMSTCPILLDECEQLRVNDSVFMFKLDSVNNTLQSNNDNLTNHIAEVGEKVVKLRWNVLKVGIGGVVVGIIIGLFAI